jgi:hypothetical protein
LSVEGWQGKISSGLVEVDVATCPTIVEEIKAQISPIHCPDMRPLVIILKEMFELGHHIRSTHNPHNAVAEVSFYLKESRRAVVPQSVQNLLED